MQETQIVAFDYMAFPVRALTRGTLDSCTVLTHIKGAFTTTRMKKAKGRGPVWDTSLFAARSIRTQHGSMLMQ